MEPDFLERALAEINGTAKKIEAILPEFSEKMGAKLIERSPVVIGEVATYASTHADNSVRIEFPTPDAQKSFFDSLKK
jgi:hypothetical protein